VVSGDLGLVLESSR